jgi:hypothetical protein
MITPRLPTDSAERKEIALDELFNYFCDALADVSKVIRRGQIQHQTEGWDRTKSTDHDACLLRHFIDRGTKDSDGISHRAKIAWRALAALQIEIEAERGLPPPRGVSVPSYEDLVREDQALMNIAPPDLTDEESERAFSLVAPSAEDERDPYTVNDLMRNPPPKGARFRIANGPPSSWLPWDCTVEFIQLTKNGIRVDSLSGLADLEDQAWRFVRLPPEQLSFNF